MPSFMVNVPLTFKNEAIDKFAPVFTVKNAVALTVKLSNTMVLKKIG
jgi:hypothetical protein